MGEKIKAAFVSKLSDAETEACESQAWLEFGVLGFVDNTHAALPELFKDFICRIVLLIIRILTKNISAAAWKNADARAGAPRLDRF